MSTPSLSIQNLSIGYPNNLLASDLTLDIIPGELTAVIGVNGSGKSTFLKTISGQLDPLRGALFLAEQPLNKFSLKTRSEYISIVLTNPEYSQNLSVYEVVALGRHPYTNWLGALTKNDKTIIQNAMERVDIQDLSDQKCNELSDGQKQKVFIARSLAQQTKFIVLDEPTNHLDLYNKAYVFKLLKKLTKDTKKAIVFATHEINSTLQLCDKIIMINKGRFIQGAPKDLIKRGVMHDLFPEDLILFDEHSNSFRMNNQLSHE